MQSFWNPDSTVVNFRGLNCASISCIEVEWSKAWDYAEKKGEERTNSVQKKCHDLLLDF